MYWKPVILTNPLHHYKYKHIPRDKANEITLLCLPKQYKNPISRAQTLKKWSFIAVVHMHTICQMIFQAENIDSITTTDRIIEHWLSQYSASYAAKLAREVKCSHMIFKGRSYNSAKHFRMLFHRSTHYKKLTSSMTDKYLIVLQNDLNKFILGKHKMCIKSYAYSQLCTNWYSLQSVKFSINIS